MAAGHSDWVLPSIAITIGPLLLWLDHVVHIPRYRPVGWALTVGPVILVATMSGSALAATTGIAAGVLLLATAAAGFHDLAGLRVLGRTRPVQTTTGDDMAIDECVRVHLGESSQWVRIRGADASNPVLLLIQQGPGLPMMNEARRFERLLGLEQEFTVVYWDQRGCGRSLRKAGEPDDISIELMVADTVSLLEWLCDRFGRDMFVIGFSLGGAIGAYAAARRPDLVETLVVVGMDIDGASAGTSAYDFALNAALTSGRRRALRQLEAIGPPPHLVLKQFSTRVRWATNFGGVTTKETYSSLARALLASMVRSPDYSAGDLVRTVRGMSATQAALLSDLASMDLIRVVPRLEMPFVMAQGRLDQVAPGEAAARFVGSVEAPSKQLAWFEESAHTPHFEEPDRFRDLIMRVRANEPAGM